MTPSPSSSTALFVSTATTTSPLTTRSHKSSCDPPNSLLNASIQEWSIPSKDVMFSEVLMTGHFGDVCRGRWHGDVMIYTFPSCKDVTDQELLFHQIALLSRLRHENLQLFMGAIIEPVPCIITDMIKGLTLYDKVHVGNEFLSRTYKISIARQVANAISYLNARDLNVTPCNITSHHIILETKVKLCLIDIVHRKKCSCLPCTSTIGLIGLFARSPIHSLKTSSVKQQDKFTTRMECTFNQRRQPSPPTSPRLLGLSNDALNFVGRE